MDSEVRAFVDYIRSGNQESRLAELDSVSSYSVCTDVTLLLVIKSSHVK